MKNEIGGYIELELNKGSHYWDSFVKLNCARNSLKYIIRAYDIKKICLPSYTCPVIWHAALEEGCKMSLYQIDDKFLPKQTFGEYDYILYTNYFGICNDNVRKLAQMYKNLMVDNAQAFYTPPYGIGSIYSPRKFFGVSDGGYAYSQKSLNIDFEQDISVDRFSHLLKRIESGANFGYLDFQKNEDSLVGSPIKQMSTLTSNILQGIDYEKAKQRRISNFRTLETALYNKNLLQFTITDDVPMYYPFLCKDDVLRQRLVENKIYIQSCWKELEENCNDEYELHLQKYLLPLIIDQRYGKDDMEKIIGVINAD